MINRRQKSGYSDLGRIQIPPMAQAIVLTDRADGTLWLVSFNTSAPEHLSISSDYSTIQHREGVRLYAADDGPKMDEDGEFTLMVRGGRLGFDYNRFAGQAVARDDPPPYSRQISAQRKLIMNILSLSNLHIGYIL